MLRMLMFRCKKDDAMKRLHQLLFAFAIALLLGAGVLQFGQTSADLVQAASSQSPRLTPPPSVDPCKGKKPASPDLLFPAFGQDVTGPSVKLSWDTAQCAKTYSVIVRRDKKSGKVVDKVKGLNDTQHGTPPLAAGYTYYWQVIAKNGSKSARSVIYKFQIP